MNENQAWSCYWQDSHLDSCIARSQQQDQQLLMNLWQQFVKNSSPNEHLLDLATGNGSVIHAIHNERQDLNLVGVDYAAISPSTSASEEEIGSVRFMGNTDISALPFKSNSFDYVTSQFGFEYADVKTASKELSRVLKKGGRCQLVIHHPNSEILTSSSKRNDELNWLLEPEGLLVHLTAYIDNNLSADQLDKCGQAYMDKYVGQLTKDVTGQIYQVIGQIISLKEHQGNNELARLTVENLMNRIKAELSRLNQLKAAAMSAENIEELIKLIGLVPESAKMKVLNPFNAPELIFGWLINGRK
ncbi:class I SAM-dependent methyltransferase [Thalassotalea atypica]|uniref:class I SAM-dependent methyltransferase n=1 Tax=Thalassotalea atypica TaxID=2054316 RepID=UPI002572A99C|nr:methyltransferase domain-containing protein [Thalassotalea atypica]